MSRPFGALPDDGLDHEFCWVCRAESVVHVDDGGAIRFRCTSCGSREDRSYYLPAAYVRWIADDGELWHESAGIFVSRVSDGRFLFFQRRIWPRALTIPAGHVETTETPEQTAIRELQEETGLGDEGLTHVADLDVIDDPCSAGAASHRWHAYGLRVNEPDLQISHEGSEFFWLTLDEALARDLISPVRVSILEFGEQINARFTT